MNALLGAVSELTVVVTNITPSPGTGFDGTQPAGNAGAVTASKFSTQVVAPGVGVGVPPPPGVGVGVPPPPGVGVGVPPPPGVGVGPATTLSYTSTSPRPVPLATPDNSAV